MIDSEKNQKNDTSNIKKKKKGLSSLTPKCEVL